MTDTTQTTPYSIDRDGTFYKICGLGITRTDFTLAQAQTVLDMMNFAYIQGQRVKELVIHEALGL